MTMLIYAKNVTNPKAHKTSIKNDASSDIKKKIDAKKPDKDDKTKIDTIFHSQRNIIGATVLLNENVQIDHQKGENIDIVTINKENTSLKPMTVNLQGLTIKELSKDIYQNTDIVSPFIITNGSNTVSTSMQDIQSDILNIMSQLVDTSKLENLMSVSTQAPLIGQDANVVLVNKYLADTTKLMEGDINSIEITPLDIYTVEMPEGAEITTEDIILLSSGLLKHKVKKLYTMNVVWTQGNDSLIKQIAEHPISNHLLNPFNNVDIYGNIDVNIDMNYSKLIHMLSDANIDVSKLICDINMGNNYQTHILIPIKSNSYILIVHRPNKVHVSKNTIKMIQAYLKGISLFDVNNLKFEFNETWPKEAIEFITNVMKSVFLSAQMTFAIRYVVPNIKNTFDLQQDINSFLLNHKDQIDELVKRFEK